MASAINGRWMCVSTEGFPEYLAAMGTAPDAMEKMVKVLNTTGANSPQQEFKMEGDVVTRRVYKPDGSLHTEDSMQLGGTEVETKAPDGRDIKVKVTVSGNKFIKEAVSDGHSAVWERTVDGDDMTLVMKTGVTVCTRKFKRV